MGNKIILRPLVAVFLFLCSVYATAQVYNTEVEAKIILESNSEFIQIKGSAYNKTEISQSLRYVLSVIKTDPDNGNRSKNDQNGRFVLNPGEHKNLSQTTVNQSEADRVIILLLLYDAEDKLMGKDRIVLNDNIGDKKIVIANKGNKDSDINEAFAGSDGLELKGLILEETKTRPGREFYAKFASDYRQSDVNGPKVVTITEGLAIANNTQIEVKVGDDIVMKFFVRPQADYMEAMEVEAIKRVIKYFKDLEEGKNIVKPF